MTYYDKDQIEIDGAMGDENDFYRPLIVGWVDYGKRAG